MPTKTALYGHTSEATAYLVYDYPYGRTVRTKIRYWLEYSPSKGYRFVSQTLNPKTQRWNAPKKSTYCALAGAMYLDEKSHVHWDGLGEYSTDEGVKAFVSAFPDANLTLVKLFAIAKVRYCKGIIDGSIGWTINGVRQVTTPEEIELKKAELEFWTTIK